MTATEITQETQTDCNEPSLVPLLRENPEKILDCGLTFEQGTHLLLKGADYTYVDWYDRVRHSNNLLQLWLAQMPLNQLLSKLSPPYIDFLLVGAGKKDVQEHLFGGRDVDSIGKMLRALTSTLSIAHVKVILGWERVKESFWDQSATGIKIFSVCQNHDLLLYMVGENGLLRNQPARAIGKVFLDIHANYPHTLTTATIRSFLDALCFGHSNVDAPSPTLHANHFTHALSFLFHITIKSTLGVVKQAYSEWFQQCIENKPDFLAALHDISPELDRSIGIEHSCPFMDGAKDLMEHIFGLLALHFNAGWEQRYGPDAPYGRYSIIPLFHRLLRTPDESFAPLIVKKLYLNPIQSEQQSEFDSTQAKAERIDVIGTIYSLLDQKVLEKYLGWSGFFWRFHKEDPFYCIVFRALVYAGHDMKTLLSFFKQSKHHLWLLQMLPIVFSAVGRDEEGYRAKAKLFEPLIDLVFQKVTTEEVFEMHLHGAQLLLYIKGRLKHLGRGIRAQTKAEIANLIQWQGKLENPETAAKKFFAEPEGQGLLQDASEGLATRALTIAARSVKISSAATVPDSSTSTQILPKDAKVLIGHRITPKIPSKNTTFTSGPTDAEL